MHIPAGRFTRGKQPLQCRAVSLLVGSYTTHGIMLCRAYGNQFVCGVDAKEIVAYLFDFPQFCVDMLSPQQPDIQPQMLAETASGGMPRGDMLLHSAGDDIP